MLAEPLTRAQRGYYVELAQTPPHEGWDQWIVQYEATVQEREAALCPLARLLTTIPPEWPDDHVLYQQGAAVLTVGHVRTAHALTLDP